MFFAFFSKVSKMDLLCFMISRQYKPQNISSCLLQNVHTKSMAPSQALRKHLYKTKFPPWIINNKSKTNSIYSDYESWRVYKCIYIITYAALFYSLKKIILRAEHLLQHYWPFIDNIGQCYVMQEETRAPRENLHCQTCRRKSPSLSHENSKSNWGSKRRPQWWQAPTFPLHHYDSPILAPCK